VGHGRRHRRARTGTPDWYRILVPVEITSKGGNAVLMSADDFRSWQETVYLLRSPANAARLMAAVAEDKAAETPLITRPMDELTAMAEDGE
jgi:antitoxin YefM